MQLKEFSLINQKLEASEVFQALKIVIGPEKIDQAEVLLLIPFFGRCAKNPLLEISLLNSDT